MPKILRSLLRVVVGLLVLAALVCGLRLWLDSKGRAVLAKYPAAASKPPRPPLPRLPGGGLGKSGAAFGKEPPQAAGRLVPVSQLAVFADIFSNDPARRHASAELQQALDLLAQHFGRGRLAGHRIHFAELLRSLGQPVGAETTEAQAAAQFIQYTEKYAGFFQGLREALREGSWDTTPRDRLTDAAAWKQMDEVLSLVRSGVLISGALMQAHWVMGEADLALSRARDMAALVRQTGNPGDLAQYYQYVWLESALVSVVVTNNTMPGARGSWQKFWRPSDMQSLSSELGSLDPLETWRTGVEGERQRALARVVELGRNPFALAAGLDAARHREPGAQAHEGMLDRIQETLRPLSYVFISDTQIAANAALVDHRFDLMLSQIDPVTRAYTPLSDKDAAFLNDSFENDDPLQQWYLAIAGKSQWENSVGVAWFRQHRLSAARNALETTARSHSPGALHPVTPVVPLPDYLPAVGYNSAPDNALWEAPRNGDPWAQQEVVEKYGALKAPR